MLAKLFLKRLLVATAIAVGAWGALAMHPQTVSAAGTFTYPRYDVDISVNKDSTVDITETLTYRFVGLFHGVLRNITLEDPSLSSYCVSSGLTCGGFDDISLLGVYDNDDKLVNPDRYTVGIETDEDTEKRTFNIKWEIWPAGRSFDGTETFTWKVKYRLLGSLGFLGTSDATRSPYLYWNALPENRGGFVDASVVTVTLPTGVIAEEKSLQVFTDYAPSYKSSFNGNVFRVSAKSLGSTGSFTIAYSLPRDSVDMPATLTYSSWLPWSGINVQLDELNLGDAGGTLRSLPSGKHTLQFSFGGYETKTVQVDAKPGELINIDATLTPTPFMLLILILNIIFNVVGLVLIPASIVYVYVRWRNKGRDQQLPATVIPLFSPPEGVHPYLLGSLKDESVDREDITGSIIDLAYRGFIKIKELDKGKNYELIKLDGKTKGPELNEIEQQLMADIFGDEDTQETKKLGDKFAPRYAKLQTKIYQEMVDRGYFPESPQATRGKYWGCAVLIIILGVFFTIGTACFGAGVIGVPGPALLGVAVFMLGVSLAVSANYMPAKTPAGSKTLAAVLGFRMYMYYAERYRVQNLQPEDFEKYLSYAVVFGIEEQWADNFKDIYKGQPDWYEGSGTLHDVYWYSAFSRSFSNSLNSTMYQPVTTGSASGGGWSGGGGSFGGFSGGGGGGGSSGAF